MKNDLKKYLEDYFIDWNLSEREKKEVNEVCENTSKKLAGFYDAIKKMIEDKEYREAMIVILDETLSEKEDDNKTDA